MPATVTTPSANGTTPATKKHHSKKRIVRRRGRSTLDSDDEIEREAQTDSDTDDSSSYVSDSETESVSEDDEHHAGIVTPSTTQSPPPLDIPGASSSAKPALMKAGPGPFAGTTDWAQIVADEGAHGAGDLPVIDFADMHAHTITEPTPAAPPRTRKAQKQNKKATAARTPPQPAVPSEAPTAVPESEPKQDEPEAAVEEPAASTSKAAPAREPRDPKGFRGQSARQAYQERLQHDPAFVPRVGEFWGHDDRLLDKDLRSLSGWWRGRWYNRGRGRGMPPRGRGRGGMPPGRPLDVEVEVEENAEEGKQEVPAIEKTWGHDGFEEMKRREEQRREDQRRSQASRQSTGSQRGGTLRGRGAFVFVARGRGGFSRGGGVSATSRAGLRADPSDPTSIPVWYAQKPEKMWTKHADNFLYFEQASRPRAGETPSIRIRLPGQPEPQLIRQKKLEAKAGENTIAEAATASTSDYGDRQFTVRIPTVRKIEKVPQPVNPQPAEPAARAQEPSIDEVFTVRPQVVPEHVPIQASGSAPGTGPNATPASSASALPISDAKSPLEQIGIGAPSNIEGSPSADIEEAVLRNPPRAEVHAPIPQQASPTDPLRPAPPPLHPIQTSFSPVPQPSPSYMSPYQYGSLPPGVGIHQGYTYELATGRPVYLHPTPPPMYAPQPMMRSYMGHPSTSVPFVPGHVHHTSQEYMPSPHTPPVNGFVDPSTGAPIFAPARQSSRIEIRAPDGKVKHVPRPSGLRMSTTDGNGEPGQLPEEQTPSDPSQSNEQLQANQEPPMMAYPAYQQPYYYPDPNGYSGYVDMSNQVAQYDYYPQYEQHYEQHAQPIVYY
ncbi:hypothetical protein PsYK624_006500 [Phanerochaete sordida]|uniref:Btz domain-containing protein n=1 Tax=Phanerochaete sordida TaxID=48140 RepID=A0A9P3FYN8_9APHY|nr:hypothetical protein PsYK624_006500 [Phanerochaete sordida]